MDAPRPLFVLGPIGTVVPLSSGQAEYWRANPLNANVGHYSNKLPFRRKSPTNSYSQLDTFVIQIMNERILMALPVVSIY